MEKIIKSSFVLAFILLFSLFHTLHAKESKGIIGLQTGLSIHMGKTVVVDGISGATHQREDSNWQKGAMAANLFIDFGLPKPSSWERSSVNFRLSSTISFPNWYLGNTLLLAYRYVVPLKKETLQSVEPWVGIGMGLHFIHKFPKDVFVVVPISLGVDVGLKKIPLYLTSEIQLNAINPIGPTQRLESETNDEEYSKYNKFMLLLGVAYRFY